MGSHDVRGIRVKHLRYLNMEKDETCINSVHSWKAGSEDGLLYRIAKESK